MTRCTHCGGTGLEPGSAEMTLEQVAALFEVEPRSIGQVPGSLSTPQSFETFWAMYPRKQARATAAARWNRMTLVERAWACRVLPDHIAMWRHEGRGTRLVPMATTWLNQRRWEDDLSGYVDEVAQHKPMPGRTGIAAAVSNRRLPRGAIGAGS